MDEREWDEQEQRRIWEQRCPELLERNARLVEALRAFKEATDRFKYGSPLLWDFDTELNALFAALESESRE